MCQECSGGKVVRKSCRAVMGQGEDLGEGPKSSLIKELRGW